MRRFRRFVFVAVTCAALLLQWPVTPLMAQIVYQPPGGGVSTSSSNTWTGTQTFIDNAFLIVDDGDNTKKIAFQASGITTGTTRTFTVPNASDTLSVLGTAQTFTAAKTFANNVQINQGTPIILAGASTTGGVIANHSQQTPDRPWLLSGTTSNSWGVAEYADRTFDFNNGPCGTAACTNPQFIAHDADQNVTDYQSLGLPGLSGKFVKTLTEASATSVVIIPVAADTSVSGQLLYTVHAKDATNSQTRSGRVLYNGVAEGVTATCVIGTPEELDNTPTGTLTATITCTSPANNQIQLLIDATSSLTQTTLEAYGQVLHVGGGEPLPQ